MTTKQDLYHERVAMQRQRREVREALLHAAVWDLPEEESLRQALHELDDRLLALALALASFEAEDALFLDFHP